MLYSDPVVIDERTTPSKGLSQAYALRDVAYQLALKLGMKPTELDETDNERARGVTALIKAWAEADDRIRIHRGKPLPGSLRPVGKAKPNQRKSSSSTVPLGVSGQVKPDPTCGVAPPTGSGLPEEKTQVVEKAGPQAGKA